MTLRPEPDPAPDLPPTAAQLAAVLADRGTTCTTRSPPCARSTARPTP